MIDQASSQRPSAEFLVSIAGDEMKRGKRAQRSSEIRGPGSNILNTAVKLVERENAMGVTCDSQPIIFYSSGNSTVGLSLLFSEHIE